MGIGQTVKNVLSPGSGDPEPAPQDVNQANLNPRGNALNDPSQLTDSSRATKLPSGTGIGTSGKGAATSPTTGGRIHSTEATMRHDADRVRSSRDISGYGTDAAAAAGGDLSGTHQTSRRLSASKPRGASLPMTSIDESDRDHIGTHRPSRPSETSGDQYVTVDRTADASIGHTGVLERQHVHGHTRQNAKEAMPSGNAVEDTNQLNPVIHERVRHLEREEVARVMDHERHIHHIQHHVQPIVASEELAEEHREKIVPVTHIRETHANKPEDNTVFRNQVHQYHDTLQHEPKERVIIDKGTTVNEHVHHHIHHVIQPIIEKETVERSKIHTTIPIHEVTYEAPVVHQSQTHAPVPMEHFLERGGTLHGAVSQDAITSKVLHTGECTREVESMASELERDLRIVGDDIHSHTHKHTHVDSGKGDLSAKNAAAAQGDRVTTTTTTTREVPVNPRSRD